MGSKTALGRAALRHAASERGASYAAVALLSAALTLLLTSSAPQSTGSHGVASSVRMQHRRLGGGGDAADWMCKHQYAVTTWDRKRVPACDPALCNATPAPLKAPAKGSSEASRRWTPRDDDAYAAASPSVSGWLNDRQVRYVRVMAALQHQLGVFGAAGEIGVHHGNFFAVIAGNAATAEPLAAVDLFEAQSEIYDLSGSGSTANILYPEKLMSLMDATGIPRADVRLVSGNSLTLTASNFTSLGVPACACCPWIAATRWRPRCTTSTWRRARCATAASSSWTTGSTKSGRACRRPPRGPRAGAAGAVYARSQQDLDDDAQPRGRLPGRRARRVWVRRRARVAVEHRGQRAVLAASVGGGHDTVPCIMRKTHLHEAVIERSQA